MAGKRWKKRAAAGVLCAAAGAGVLVSSVIDCPDTLLREDGVAVAAMPADDGAAASEEARKDSSLRRWLLALPAGVRALGLLPLWVLGWGVTELAALLWQAVVSPVGGTVASWLLTALLSLGAFALTAKVICPDIPLKKLLRPRSILLITAGVLCFGILDTLLPLFWEEAPSIGRWLRLGGTALVIAIGCLSLRKRYSKAEKAPIPTAAQQAMALADTVCPPRHV